MTDEELAAIRARAEAATPGPWGVVERYDMAVRYNKSAYKTLMEAIVNDRGELVVPLTFGSRLHHFQNPRNEEFIAHAREDIPALLAEVEQLRAIQRDTRLSEERQMQRANRLANENAALREIVQAVANLEARQSEVWNEVGLFHDSTNVLYIRQQARALLGTTEGQA